MTFFTLQPANRPLYDNWTQTTEDWNCQWEYKDNFRRLFIPKGYVSDGASIPRIAWTALGLTPDGEIRAAALAHDSLYRAKGGRIPDGWRGCMLMNQNGNTVRLDRKEADWVFLQFCIFATVDANKARRAWRWVRAWGWLYWGKDAPGGPVPPSEDDSTCLVDPE